MRSRGNAEGLISGLAGRDRFEDENENDDEDESRLAMMAGAAALVE